MKFRALCLVLQIKQREIQGQELDVERDMWSVINTMQRMGN
jgi:hypothetical protein